MIRAKCACPERQRRIVRGASSSLAVALLLSGCGPSGPTTTPVPGPTSGVAANWPYAGKARVVEGAQAMVVSGSPIASDVGRQILQAGGNAVDAATAVGFALAVVHPEAGNIGGGGFSMIRLADGSVSALDYREATRRFQRRYLLDVLTECDWSIPDAMRRLGLARSQIYNLIALFGLKRPKDPS